MSSSDWLGEHMGFYTAEERRRLREERRMEREQRQIARMVQQQKTRQRKKSSTIPAKWYPRGKAVVISDNTTGEKIKMSGGMYYAGSNVMSLVSPTISEPSLVNPIYEVRFVSEDVMRTSKFLDYKSLTPEQRGEYIKFLASGRKSSPNGDIGYPFIYLYGLERRLLVDTKKPGEVSQEEHTALVKEVFRLLKAFREQSKPFALYAAALLLYDGTILPSMGEETFLDLFAGDTLGRRFSAADTTDAYEYMLLARMAERGFQFPSEDLLNYCRVRPFRHGAGTFLNYGIRDMFATPVGTTARRLLSRRYGHSSLNEPWPTTQGTEVSVPIIGSRILPEYRPGSEALRKASVTNLHGRMLDLEGLGVPFKQISDMSVTCMGEVSEYAKLLDNGTLRGLSDVKLDVIALLTPPKRLARGLKTRATMAIVPGKVIAQEMRDLMGVEPSVTQRGVLTAQTQTAYQVLVASMGWQLILPDSLPRDIGRHMKVGIGDDLVAFKRGVRYDNRNGTQLMGDVFGRGDILPGLPCPEEWLPSIRATVVFAWFVRQFTQRLPLSEFTRYLAALRPPIKKSRADKQLLMFFCLANALLRYGMTPTAAKECLKKSDFSVIKRAVFMWCQTHYGVMLPTEVMTALEKLYQKADSDKASILYDYHAFTAGDTSLGATPFEFAIDDDRLQATIQETSGVHVILNDALSESDEAETADAGEDFLSEETDVDMDDIILTESDITEDSSQEDESVDIVGTAAAYIKSVYADADTDELPTATLQQALMEQFGMPTMAAALGLLSDVNAAFEASSGEALVDVDGPDAYLN